MTLFRAAPLAGVLDAAIAAGEVPSASICVRVCGEAVFTHTVGAACLVPVRRMAVPDQAYDLASLTKPLVGAAVAAELLETGRLTLATPVAHYLGGIVDPRLQVHHLLAHTGGYPAWEPLYERLAQEAWDDGDSRDHLMTMAASTSLISPPGDAYCYSDIGAITLTAVLEAAGGDRIDVLVAPLLERLQIDALRWGWPQAAATEDCPVRGRVIEGEVHDLNARAMGGRSVHAGLFGTAAAVARAGEAWLDAACGRRSDLPGGLFGGWQGAAPGVPLSGASPGRHVAGWQRRGDGVGTTGPRWPTDTVGHLGFTGTSLWMAPGSRVVVALLTNRVHPSRTPAIGALRERVHDAVAHAVGLTAD